MFGIGSLSQPGPPHGCQSMAGRLITKNGKAVYQRLDVDAEEQVSVSLPLPLPRSVSVRQFLSVCFCLRVCLPVSPSLSPL